MSTHGSLSEVELFNLLYKSSFNKVCCTLQIYTPHFYVI